MAQRTSVARIVPCAGARRIESCRSKPVGCWYALSEGSTGYVQADELKKISRRRGRPACFADAPVASQSTKHLDPDLGFG